MLLTLAAIAGCGGGGAAVVPSADEARQALETTLRAWKDGKPMASLPAGMPKIEAADFEWEAGKKLADFSIGAEKPGVGTKDFSVTLTLAPKQIKEVTYMVLGKDPYRIFRDEDFQRAVNMESRPDPPKAKTKRRR